MASYLWHRPNSKSLLNEQAFLHLGFCSPGKQSAAGGENAALVVIPFT
ncbi:TPA: hypothetical protein I8271_004907 [Kluyvera intermedia]|uniref:Uncharacterized protein n=1 Tax=Kluyvera intermedia TaxID=61648 RepID=A0A9P3TBL4_KLUIN|nr:hypothetical protein [Kluyvera intermedia]HAT2516976.1 hypothetical protein [Kluyvera intermedia]HAT2604855.1 hypothetical protein [Kluyvera intermedia]HAT2682336.1 hypothetical protein [Kluyvera intermedia]HAT2699470.1 hypothetical protein [Kluyvera intermedia]